MKPEEINRAIAELCGIEVVECSCKLIPKDAKTDRHIPDYHASLDACAEFEKTLWFGYSKETHGQTRARITYEDSLIDACENPLFATAPQRCEAFLRLHGKWR